MRKEILPIRVKKLDESLKADKRADYEDVMLPGNFEENLPEGGIPQLEARILQV